MSPVNEPEIRVDSQGDGHFGSPRGSRTHRGVDYLVEPGQDILSPCDGVVTKHGYCYGDDHSWRYIQITNTWGGRHRIFYVDAMTPPYRVVRAGEAVAIARDISQRYEGMTPHVHYEFISPDGEYVDPETL